MTRLERVTNVCMVVVSVAILGDLGTRYWNGGRTDAASRSTPSTYQIGEALADIPALPRAPDQPSLLFVVRSTCQFCTMSMPFYERLVTEVRTSGARVRLSGVCTEPTDTCAQYLDKLGLDQVAGVAPGSLKIVGTPTLLLVAADGRVQQIWSGRLSPDGERTVIAAVTGKTTS